MSNKSNDRQAYIARGQKGKKTTNFGLFSCHRLSQSDVPIASAKGMALPPLGASPKIDGLLRETLWVLLDCLHKSCEKRDGLVFLLG
jgi:hypothetical protein